MAEEYQSIIYYLKIWKSGREKADFGGGVSIYNDIIYYFKIWKSVRAKADFGGGASIYNLLFKDTEIGEGKG